ncbi:MAG: cupin domain-containing protein [Chromatiales bacterium]|nr:cupin domain-containing protein [Chromatiales bacterium]
MFSESDGQHRIVAVYRARIPPSEALALGRRIAHEQTVELPEDQITDPHVRESVLGRVDSVQAVDPHRADISISYDVELGRVHLSQLLNLVFGNVSMYRGVKLMDVQLPPTLLATFRGPNLGVEGLRRVTGVYGRPLLASALKPKGLSIERLSTMAARFALGGGDIIKDDQNLVDDFDGFKRRSRACLNAVEAANDKTGRRCLYFPHVAAPGPELRRHFEYVVELGAPGVLMCPLIAGFDSMRALAAESGLAVMAHPSMAGPYVVNEEGGVKHGVLLGDWMRLAGADVSVFPNAGGRFSFSPAECEDIARHLRKPLGALAPAWPAPAGGMSFDSLPAMVEAYGDDTVVLMGGALFGQHKDLSVGTRMFVDALDDLCSPRYETPQSVEVEPAPAASERCFSFAPGYQWQGRPSSPYKDGDDDSFKGVRRVELVGTYGEKANADLRYFEIEPGGFSSRESHLHTHIVIGARGEGVLTLGNERVLLAVNDVAYIEPLEVHQLHNKTPDPFGFFCIVEHDRDRPIRESSLKSE